MTKPIPTRTTLPGWCKPFIGIPYKLYGRDFHGVDCWGEVYLVAKHHFVIDFPEYGPDSADARELCEIDDLVRDEITSIWTRIEADPLPGDLALFRNEHGLLVHVGIIVDSTWMLHCSEGSMSRALRRNEAMNRLIEGYYRLNVDDLVA